MGNPLQTLRAHLEEVVMFAFVWGILLLILSSWSNDRFSPGVVVTSGVIAFGLVFAFVKSIGRRNRKLNTAMKLQTHPVLGEVRVFAERWEADVAGAPFPNRIELSGGSDANGPSENQMQTLAAVKQKFATLMEASLAALAGVLGAGKTKVRVEDLALHSIFLGDAEEPEFSFYFKPAGRGEEWTLAVDFENFEVTFAEWAQ